MLTKYRFRAEGLSSALFLSTAGAFRYIISAPVLCHTEMMDYNQDNNTDLPLTADIGGAGNMFKKDLRGRFFLLFLIFALLLPSVLSGCGNRKTPPPKPSASPDPRRAEQIVEKMLLTHGSLGDEGQDRVRLLLEELSAVDAGTSSRWQAIMELWRSPELGQPLAYDVLPDGLPDTEELCLVVLGFQLNPDGTMKDELVGRLEVALRSLTKYPRALVVCTGGGTAAADPSATEAGKMAGWLEEHGVARERIITEDNSLTTAQNAIFTYDLLTCRCPQVRKLAIVSSDYHIATGELLFEAEAILRAPVPGCEKLEVVGNAAWKAPSGTLSPLFQAGALTELLGDVDRAFEIYYGTYDIHSLPALKKGSAG